MDIVQKYLGTGNLKAWIKCIDKTFEDATGNYVANGTNMYFNNEGLVCNGTNTWVNINDASFQFDASGTMTLAFHFTKNDMEGAFDTLSSHSWYTNTGYYVAVNTNGYVYFCDENADTTNAYRTNEKLKEGTEGVVIITYDNGTVKMYVNGVRGETLVGSPSWTSTVARPFFIISETYASNNFNGIFKHSMKFDIVLDDTECALLSHQLINMKTRQKPEKFRVTKHLSDKQHDSIIASYNPFSNFSTRVLTFPLSGRISTSGLSAFN